MWIASVFLSPKVYNLTISRWILTEKTKDCSFALSVTLKWSSLFCWITLELCKGKKKSGNFLAWANRISSKLDGLFELKHSVNAELEAASKLDLGKVVSSCWNGHRTQEMLSTPQTVLSVLHCPWLLPACSLCAVKLIVAQQCTERQFLSKPYVSGGMGIPARSDTETCPGIRVLDSELDTSWNRERRGEKKVEWEMKTVRRQ